MSIVSFRGILVNDTCNIKDLLVELASFTSLPNEHEYFGQHSLAITGSNIPVKNLVSFQLYAPMDEIIVRMSTCLTHF